MKRIEEQFLIDSTKLYNSSSDFGLIKERINMSRFKKNKVKSLFKTNIIFKYCLPALCSILIICMAIVLVNLDLSNEDNLPGEFKPGDNNPDEPEIITSGANDYHIIDPNRIYRESFQSCAALKNYLVSSNFNITSKTLYLLDVDPLKTPYDFYNSIAYNYEAENKANMYIELSLPLFDETIGADRTSNGYDGMPLSSYYVKLRSIPFNYNGGEFEYKLYDYSDGVTMFNNVVYVYYNDEVVCYVYYQSEHDLTVKYWQDLFKKYELFIN